MELLAAPPVLPSALTALPAGKFLFPLQFYFTRDLLFFPMRIVVWQVGRGRRIQLSGV